MEFPESLLYTKEHEWVKVEANEARVGITDYAQKELGDIVFAELPAINEELEQSKRFGVFDGDLADGASRNHRCCATQPRNGGAR